MGERALIETKFGEIEIEFLEDKAPGHVKNFLDCVRSRQRTVCDMEAGFAASLPPLLANVSIQEERLVKWDGNKAV